MKTVRVVAAVIKATNEKGEPTIFATARGYGEYKGWWEFPGGKIEPGETPEAALVREIKEELESEIEVREYIDTIEYDYPEFHLSMRCYFCKLISGELKLLEAEDAKWLTKESIDDVKWLPADLVILKKIKDALNDGNVTLDYYNNNALKFVSGTVDVAFTEVQDKFLSYLPTKAAILDFGCGSGRDTKYFIEKGYRVDATDGSLELCKMASDLTGIQVKQLLFQELDEECKYDGIWACSSILHLSKAGLREVIPKMIRATKNSGYIYTSFKYGDFEGYRNERYFTDFTEKSFVEFLNDYEELSVIEYWISGDVRPGRGEEKWLNLILQKSGII